MPVGTFNPIDVYVGSRLRDLRKARGLNQQKLAVLVDLAFQQIQKYETGANRISVAKLFEIAAKLQVTVNYFYDGYDVEGIVTEVEGISGDLSVHDFLQTPEGRELALQFARITNPKVRRKIVELARSLLEAQGGD